MSNERNELVTKQEITSALRYVGVAYGQTVLVHSSLSNLGILDGVADGDRLRYCSEIYDCFDSLLGISQLAGTLIVPTFTHDYVRKRTPFILQDTPSETGIFSEYVRRLPLAMRTMHPIASLAVVGKAKSIFEDLSSSAYGINSAFDRIAQMPDARLVYFGANANHTTLLHHLEQLVGVSYMYNKAYFSPDVYINQSERVERPFFSAVRYLNGKVTITYFGWENEMRKRGLLQVTNIGAFNVMSCRVSDALSVGYELLQRNPCAFLEAEFFMTE